MNKILDPKDAAACQANEDRLGELGDRYEEAYAAEMEKIKGGDDEWLGYFQEADFHQLALDSAIILYKTSEDYDSVDRLEDLLALHEKLHERYCHHVAARATDT